MMTKNAPGHVLLLGFGYVAGFLARALQAQGWRIAATGRTEEAVAEIEKAGYAGWFFDGGAPLPEAAWEGVTHVLSSIPPTAAGDPALLALADDLCRRAAQLRWAGYLSTVGVYGDHDGAWVDEETPCRPVSERGKRRLAAEQAWLALHERCGVPVHIFRLPGIYGPGRNPLRKALDGARKAIVVKEGQVFSRIHVDDLVSALMLSMAQPRAGRIYNVVDDEPAPPHEVALFAHELLGLEPPPLKPFEEVEMSAMARSFYGESKRVSNARLKRELGWKPTFPTYREGLRALVESERHDIGGKARANGAGREAQASSRPSGRKASAT